MKALLARGMELIKEQFSGMEDKTMIMSYDY